MECDILPYQSILTLRIFFSKIHVAQELAKPMTLSIYSYPIEIPVIHDHICEQVQKADSMSVLAIRQPFPCKTMIKFIASSRVAYWNFVKTPYS